MKRTPIQLYNCRCEKALDNYKDTLAKYKRLLKKAQDQCAHKKESFEYNDPDPTQIVCDNCGRVR